MSAPRLIRTTDTATLSVLSWKGKPVIGQHEDLSAMLERKGLHDLRHLFALPVPGKASEDGYNQISWYSPLQGSVAALSDFQGADREEAQSRLASQLSLLQPHLNDPEIGGLLRRAVILADDRDISFVFGHPVLINWGLAPAAAIADEAALTAHWDSTLGRYAAFKISSLDPTAPAVSATPATAAGVGVAAAAFAAATTTSRSTMENRLPWYQRPWSWVACGVGLAAAGLLFGLFLRPYLGGSRDIERAREVQAAVNAGLNIEIDRLRGVVTSANCAPDGTGGRSIVDKPITAAEGQTAPPGHLNDLLEASTALVVNTGAGATGSGFFVAPGVLVTNDHVVDGGAEGQLFITSKVLGKVHPAHLVGKVKSNGRDYAILKIDGDLSQSKQLAVVDSVDKLAPVVAAGYPGLLINQDPGFAKLKDGDITGAPELAFSEGIVSTKLAYETEVIAHTAVISQGNSGGPLVDRCGRVVGINTMISVSDISAHQANMALSAADLRKYLEENRVDLPPAAGRCAGPAS